MWSESELALVEIVYKQTILSKYLKKLYKIKNTTFYDRDPGFAYNLWK